MKTFLAILKTGFAGLLLTSFATFFAFVIFLYKPISQFLPSDAAAPLAYAFYTGIAGQILTIIACVRVIAKGISSEKTSTRLEEGSSNKSSKEEFSGINNSIKI